MYRMAGKSVYQSKVEYLPYDSRKRTDFIPVMNAYSSFISKQDRVRIFLVYPVLARTGFGRAGCRTGQGETLYPGNLNIKF